MRRMFAGLVFTAMFTLVAAPAGATFAGDFKAQLKRHIRRAYQVNLPTASVVSGGQEWATLGSISIVVPLNGSVRVTASGTASFPTPANPSEGNALELRLSASGGLPGMGARSWHLTGSMREAFTVEFIYPVPPGTWSFTLEGYSTYGGSGQIEVDTNLLSAEFLSGAVTPSPLVE